MGLGGFCAHGLKREAYMFPLASNVRGVIHDGEQPCWQDRPFGEITDYWKARWAVPRAARLDRYTGFDKKAFFDGVRGLFGVSS